MANNSVVDNSLLQSVVALAKQAGAAVKEVYDRCDMEISCKVDGSLLTQADIASNHVIVDGLVRLTPAVPTLSEESAQITYAERCNWVHFWLVDPLDGTKEFVSRNGEFTVNIALIEHSVPVLGVVYAPALDVCYYGARGLGAFVQHGSDLVRSMHVKRIGESGPLKVVSSRSHGDARTAALLERIGEHLSVSMGSSLKLCLVAEGEADFYPRLGPTMEWDTAAAHAVVSEAGGVVCDAQGSELRYNKPDLHNPEFVVCSKDEQRNFLGILNRR